MLFLIISSMRWRIVSIATFIPMPNSALSSNSEFAHATPLPSSFVVYGVDGAEPPYIELQPVAFATIMRSPKSLVISVIYGVSPHPGQAPWNSKSGLAKPTPLTLSLFIRSSL